MPRAGITADEQRPLSSEQRLVARLRLVASAGVGFAILALLSGALSGSSDSAAAAIWMPTGLSYALALRIGFWAIPVPVLGVALSHLPSGTSVWTTTLTIALAQAGATAAMVLLSHRWMRGLDLFASLRNLLSFLAAASVAAALGTGLTALAVPALRDWSPQGDALAWWGREMAGVITLAPFFLAWLGRNAAPRLRELGRAEFLLLLTCGLAAWVIADQGFVPVLSQRPQSLLLPLMIWSGLRFSPPAATLANGVLSLGLSRLPDQQPLPQGGSAGLEALELLQLGVGSGLLVGLVVLVVSSNRSRASRQLAQLANSLERTVAERTEQLAMANAQLRHLSETDGLTGLVNRRHFDALLHERWRQAANAGSSLALALIDVDHFKRFNDRHGHQAGDHCLQQVAAVLAGQMRTSSDCAARYGGEEFVILWSDLSLQQAASLAEQLRQAVWHLQLAHADSPVSPWVTLSIGVAAASPNGSDAAGPAEAIQTAVDALLRLADERLYTAKSQGRNRVLAG